MASSISTATATNPYYLNCSRSLRCGQSLVNITYPFLLPESPTLLWRPWLSSAATKLTPPSPSNSTTKTTRSRTSIKTAS
ncbi:hypothetical protein HPP92_021339 [Vanilla planifolia]|uniref:Uncharacterized protein n=1 Tax=Vanilla planifolia TaxID=51239 RepID=A0A835UIP2_VANPL|nr:hypothetical protein HPP92_021638 [Vanilla planifolia]KAG0462863.1 hypothetical protein HPP92_021339 [Vanilla planifolia]